MTDVFVRTAALAIEEAGDPTGARGALAGPAAIERRPRSRVPRVEWAASQIVAHAETPARAYKALRELVAALYEPVAGAPRQYAPAPEVALALAPPALLDAICAPPRVLAAEVARQAKLDPHALLADPRSERRILGVRVAGVAKHAVAFADAIATDPDPGVRAEALATCTAAGEKAHTAVAAALQRYASGASPDGDEPPGSSAPPASGTRTANEIRVAAIDAIQTWRRPIAAIAALLADPAPAVRAAAIRGLGRRIYPPEVDRALVELLADGDAGVRFAALGAIARGPDLHTQAIVEPLLALLREPGDTRGAVFVLARLHDDRIAPALRECVTSARSDVATAAQLVLRELGGSLPCFQIELPLADRLARARAELADRHAYAAGVHEARRLGRDAAPLVAPLRGLAERISDDESPEARAALAQIRELLLALGETELPRGPSRLESYRGAAPLERETHGAYTIAELPGALGIWDAGTGKRLVVVDGAQALAFVHGRAEIAVVRDWQFERYAIPSGDRLAALAIPAALAYGTPVDVAVAADLATVWCDDDRRATGRDAAPYRFHIKLGDPDRLLDDTPVPGRRSTR